MTNSLNKFELKKKLKSERKRLKLENNSQALREKIK